MITIGSAVQRVSEQEGRPVHLMHAKRFPEDVLVIMTDEVSEPDESLSGQRLRQIRLTTFVDRSPVTGTIVRTEWVPREEQR